MEPARACRCCGAGGAEPTDRRPPAAWSLHAEMLQDTFNVRLSQAKSALLSRYICDACIVQLSDACSFKQRVLSTEQRLVDLLHGHNDKLEDGLSGLKEEVPFTSRCSSDWGDTDYGDSDYNETISHLKQIKTEALSQSSFKKRKRKPSDDEAKLIANVKKAMKIEPQTKAFYKLNMERLLEVNRCVRKVLENEGDMQNGFVMGLKTVPATSVDENIDSIQKIPMFKKIRLPLGKAITPAVKPKRPVIDPDTTNTVGPGLSAAEKRAVRKIIKRNALAIIKNTTACPFVYFHGNFKCFYCRETFFDFTLLKTHTIEVHGDVKQESRKIYSFRDLMLVDISTLKCRRCEQDFTDIASIKEHLINSHNVKINLKHNDDIAAFKLFNAQNFKCHLCDEEFHVFRSLSLHLNKHYQNYMCDICGKPFISWERYKNHEATHTVGHYPCTKCDQVFTTIKSRASHSMAEHRITKYGCPLCSERFDKYLERTVHMSVAHNVTHKFKCPQCAKEFFHKPHLRAHINNRHRPKEKKVECLECGMRFTDNNALSRHMVSHTGEKLFVCKICGKKYGRKYSLTEHMRVHAKGHVRSRPTHLLSF